MSEQLTVNKQVRLKPSTVRDLDIIRQAMSYDMMINVSLSDIIRIFIDKGIAEYKGEEND